MSALRVGSESGTGGAAQPDNGVKSAIDGVVKWVPSDTLTLYAATITGFQLADLAESTDRQRIFWWLFWLAFSAIVVFLTAWAVNRKTLIGGVTTCVAFLIWTVAVPGSGWQAFNFFQENSQAATVVAAAAGILLAIVAQKIDPDHK